jgi:hypothetical protein
MLEPFSASAVCAHRKAWVRVMAMAEEVKRLAVELAKSGQHIDCLTIEAQLDKDGIQKRSSCSPIRRSALVESPGQRALAVSEQV